MLKQPSLIVTVFLFTATSCGGRRELQAQFVGCFSSSARIAGHAYTVDTLTYNVCLRLCLEKNVKYAGIEALKRTCYCGNNLVHQSEKVKPHLCDEDCSFDKTKTCGGQEFLSMYRIQDEVPPTFMVATDNGIAYFKNKVLSRNFAYIYKVATIKLAYHYAENQIYFIADNKIWRSQYKAAMMEYMPATVLVQMNAEGLGLTLDWVSRKLYWLLPSKLIESNLDGSSRREIAYLKSSSKDLSIDPYERKLFFIQEGTIHMYDLKSSKMMETNILKFSRFEEVTCLTVDPQRRVVYAVGFYERRRGSAPGDGYLVSTGYYGSMFTVLLRRRELGGTFSLIALDGQIFWAEINQKGIKKTLYTYSAPSQNNGLGESRVLSTLPMTVQDVKLHDQRTQMSQNEYFCEKNKCSHMCMLTSAFSVECSCPENWSLAADQQTCQENELISRDDVDDPLELDLDDFFTMSEEVHKKNKNRRKHERQDFDYEHDESDEPRKKNKKRRKIKY